MSHDWTADLNIGHSRFAGENDSGGLMICGYEWGHTKRDQAEPPVGDPSVPITFANKADRYGVTARRWRFDARIRGWFRLWGHPLSSSPPGPFERSIVQTNWCRTQGHKLEGNVAARLAEGGSVGNFLHHVEQLQPSVMLLMGTALNGALTSPGVLDRFVEHVGSRMACSERTIGEAGRSFRVWFHDFERCSVVILPHPSGSYGLKGEYIADLRAPMGERLARYRAAKGLPAAGVSPG